MRSLERCVWKRWFPTVKFAGAGQRNAEPDLAAMGLDIISFQRTEFRRFNQVIENLGIDNIVKSKEIRGVPVPIPRKKSKLPGARANKGARMMSAFLPETEDRKEKQRSGKSKSGELKKESDIKRAGGRLRRTRFRKSSREREAGNRFRRCERYRLIRSVEVEAPCQRGKVTENPSGEVKEKPGGRGVTQNSSRQRRIVPPSRRAQGADQFEKSPRRAERKPGRSPALCDGAGTLGIKAKVGVRIPP